MIAVIVALWFFDASSHAASFVLVTFGVAYFVSGYCLTAQRLRDIGLTGWLALLWIPVGIADRYIGGAASLIFVIVLAVVPGSLGDNRYGPDPLRSAR
jgi:uncharacterized membrane protein YhaH (DUF805 family)